ncbi:hypothetical protein ACIQ1H_15910 [Lysinibacillus sp. NPDC097279]|uniref:hypothetical protein n=1 Tax=Lysinibacillus sp. NPDC097279 TaxID=3364143 RepID=UPI003830C494
MEEQLINETKESYYTYVRNIPLGCKQIAGDLRLGNMSIAFENIMNLAEGLDWLLQVEEKLYDFNLTINSRLKDANAYIIEINNALEKQDYITVADIFEYEIHPLFDSVTEWTFEQRKIVE